MSSRFSSQRFYANAINKKNEEFFEQSETGDIVPTRFNNGGSEMAAVFPLQGPAVVDMASDIKDRILQSLPEGSLYYASALRNLHCTLFFNRKWMEAREVMSDERNEIISQWRRLADAANPILIKLDRVVLDNNGVVLLLFQEDGPCSSDAIVELRAKAAEAFPGHPDNQAHLLVHTSLLRLVKLPEK
eukprot:gene15004-17736_t